jgi:DNA-binding beta-propeller fold protein YncE
VTITTLAAHGLQVGAPVLVQGVSDNSFNGYYTVASVPSSNTFTYAQSPTLPAVAAGVGSGTATYASAVVSIGTSLTVQGVAVNDETQQALVVDPTGAAPVQVFNLLDQSFNSITFPTSLSSEQPNTVAASFNPLADVGITVNNTTGDAVLVNPDPAHLGLLSASPFQVGSHPVDVAIDPTTDEAIFVNQGSNTSQPGTVSIFALGALRAAPQIVQVSTQATNPSGYVAPPGPAVIDGPAVVVGSSLATGVNQSGSATAVPQTLTITGGGFTAGSKVRLDGTPLAAASASANGRQITAQIPASMQLAPHRYAVDVVSSSSVSNASSFTVVQRVDLTQGNTSTCVAAGPQPQGVAIDDNNNLAVVTEPGCGNVAIIDLATGTARSSGTGTVAVGSGPGGVGVFPSAGLAVVANLGSSTASIVDEINADVVASATTDQSPIGATVDQGSGNALVAASGANVMDVFATSSTPGTPSTDAVGLSPVGVAVDPATHLAAISNSSAGTVSLVDLTGTNGTQTASGFSLPEGIALDPCIATSPQTGDCASSGFVVASATGNLIQTVNPATLSVSSIRVGINPTSVAYNFNSSTLITANPQSQTISVLDFLDHTVRAVFSASASSLFGIAIHPLTNLAVVADSTNNQILLVPLPR